jgi:hypothetical protein
VGINGTEGTRLDALETGYTSVFVELDGTITACQGADWAYLGAGRHFTLATNDWHAHDRVRVGIDDSYCRFLGIVYPEVMDGTDKLTYTAAGALLRDNGQFSGH